MVFKLSEPCVQLKFPVLKEQFVFLGFFFCFGLSCSPLPVLYELVGKVKNVLSSASWE